MDNRSNKDVLDIFNPVIKNWFKDCLGDATPPQIEAWPHIKKDENVLISAPTGTGKTLSAFLVCINDLFERGKSGKLDDTVQVLYISPLKALNNDIYRNLEVPLEGIKNECEKENVKYVDITKAVRTGDTPQSERRRMLKKPPHILITTPESLYLILSSKAKYILRGVRYVIVDEIHSVMSSKRGVHLSLSLERLARLSGNKFVRIGLSATVNPLSEAVKFLAGYEQTESGYSPRKVAVVNPKVDKKMDLKVELPVKDFNIKGGSIWHGVYEKIYSIILKYKSTLVFVNNRAQAERIAVNLNALAGWEIAKTHHGCISKEQRFDAEKKLKSGELKCLVATSSMELGIDVGSIEYVIQVESPKSVSRGMQRIGRAGHTIKDVSRGVFIPITRGDLIECTVIAHEMMTGAIESQYVPKKCLDILAQQIVSMACTEDMPVNEIYKIAKATYAYHDIEYTEITEVIKMLTGYYEHKEDIPRSPRIIYDGAHDVVIGNDYSRMLAYTGSTIPDRGYYGVYTKEGNARIGELDEEFVFESRIGDRFMLGTSSWIIDRIGKDRVIVSQSKYAANNSPFWKGEGLERPYEFGLKMGAFFKEVSEYLKTDDFMPWIKKYAPIDENAAEIIEQYLTDEKESAGMLPSDKCIIVEHFHDETGDNNIVIHSTFGGRINTGLSMLAERALSSFYGCEIMTSHNDDSVLIHTLGIKDKLNNIFDMILQLDVREELISMLPLTAYFALTFRYSLYRALMTGINRGKRNPLWIQRLKAFEDFKIAQKYKDHPLIIETYRECLNNLLDVASLEKLINEIITGRIDVIEITSDVPSPFCSNILFGFAGTMMYFEPKESKTGKLLSSDGLLQASGFLQGDGTFDIAENAADVIKYAGKEIDDGVLSDTASENGITASKAIKNAEKLYEFVKIYGDIKVNDEEIKIIDKLCAGNFGKFKDELIKGGSLCLFNNLLIDAQDKETYARAFASGGINDDGCEIVRRFLRYRSPAPADRLAQRYRCAAEQITDILNRLKSDGLAFSKNDLWYHIIIGKRAVRGTVKKAVELKRKAVVSQDINIFANFVYRWNIDSINENENALYAAVYKARCLYLPAAWWEDIVFPARVAGFSRASLEELCRRGLISWKIKEEGKTVYLAWFTPGDINYDKIPDQDRNLDDTSLKLIEILKRRGACFFDVLLQQMGITSELLIETIAGLVRKGIISNDSYLALDNILKEDDILKNRIRRRVNAREDSGRWYMLGESKMCDIEHMIDVWFDRYGILYKEIPDAESSPVRWQDAYYVLSKLEMLGNTVRGYFINGVGGIQFARNDCLNKFLNASDGIFLLNSCDPVQIYGKCSGEADKPWTNSPGTVVGFDSGSPVLTFEKYGSLIRILTDDETKIQEILKMMIDLYKNKRIFTDRSDLILKEIIGYKDTIAVKPIKSEIKNILLDLGFEREMLDLIYYR